MASGEDSYSLQRAAMVKQQLAARGLRDRRVLDVMAKLPRHEFVPEAVRGRAYDDGPVDIGAEQTISQPYMVALMTQMLELKPSDIVLEIGTGSGYQCAVLALLAEQVYTIERVPGLSARALHVLRALGIFNVTARVGDGTLGWQEAAPFDAIMVTAGGPHISPMLQSQLADGGRLICPVGSADRQRLLRIVRNGDTYETEESVECVFVPLIGREGWSQ